uniref:UBC core domain-containing protein n=1 Tax=Aotus nancymaae TaxID=37293 RepID=A0A2K5CDY2_AOTNA
MQNSNVENLPPHIIRLVYKEVTTLTTDPPDGIKVFPNEEDLTDLQVTIEGPGDLSWGRTLDLKQGSQTWLPWT